MNSHAHSLTCKELGNDQCDFMARGDNESDVKQNMIDQATTVHSDRIDSDVRKVELRRKIDSVLAGKRDAWDEGRGEPVKEDESQGGEFLEDDSQNDDRTLERRAVDNARD